MNNITNCNWTVFIQGQPPGNDTFMTRAESYGPNRIIKNNFIQNRLFAIFEFYESANVNIWTSNYWGRPRIFPKIILGLKMITIEFLNKVIGIPNKFQVDWRPAFKPYDIPRIAI